MVLLLGSPPAEPTGRGPPRRCIALTPEDHPELLPPPQDAHRLRVETGRGGDGMGEGREPRREAMAVLHLQNPPTGQDGSARALACKKLF